MAEFDRFLVERHLSFQAVVIGATALALLGIISRETQDCDVLDPKIPDSILEASREFAAQKRKIGAILKKTGSTMDRIASRIIFRLDG